jgi:hypothetical protein
MSKDENESPQFNNFKRPHAEQDDETPAGGVEIWSAKESRRISGLYPLVLARELNGLVAQKDPNTLRMLSELFPATEYPAVQMQEHCVYCCTNFDKRETTSKCIIEHCVEDCDRDYKNAAGSHWSGNCTNCGEELVDTVPVMTNRQSCLEKATVMRVRTLPLRMTCVGSWNGNTRETMRLK